MGDKITLKGIKAYGFHGVLPEEKIRGQFFEVDVILYLPLAKAAATDDLDHTVNYVQVYDYVKKSFRERNYNLLEAAAGSLADKLLDLFSVEKVAVRIRKPNVPLRNIDYTEVEVVRGKN